MRGREFYTYRVGSGTPAATKPSCRRRQLSQRPQALPLPAGEPLDVPGIDDYMARQNTAGLVIVQDGKIRLEGYGLGFDAQGHWTSFSVAKSFTSTLGSGVRISVVDL